MSRESENDFRLCLCALQRTLVYGDELMYHGVKLEQAFGSEESCARQAAPK